MPRTCLGRTALVLLGWVMMAGLSRAGEPNPYYPKTPAGATELPPGYPPVDSSPSKHPLLDWWRYGKPLFCWASFNGYGCQSRHSMAVFIFGSCREFYSEPCLKGAPPSAVPSWAGARSGYRPLENAPGVGPYGPAVLPDVPYQPKPVSSQPMPERCLNCGRW